MAQTLSVKKDGTKFAVVDEKGVIIDTNFASRKEANEAIKKFRADVGEPHVEPTDLDPEAWEDEDADDESDDDTDDDDEAARKFAEEEEAEAEPEEEPTEHNPAGLSAHARISGLLRELAKRGIRVSEQAAHRHQNPQTTPDNFARRPATGINSLPPESEPVPPADAEQSDPADDAPAE